MKTNKLIQIYFYVCDLYNTELRWEVQRFSPNNDIGKITDEEPITIYLFSMLDEKLKIKSMHEHISNYWKSAILLVLLVFVVIGFFVAFAV